MPTETEIQTGITELQAIAEAAATDPTAPRLMFSEIVTIYWPDETRVYCFTQIDEVPGFQGISALVPYEINSRLITSPGQRFIKLPRSNVFEDDKIELTFSDIDGEISRLTWQFGQGVRVAVFSFYPQVDLLLEEWTGSTGAPKSANGITLKLSIASGFRSPNLLLPNRLPAVSCQFIFGRHLDSQSEIDAHKGCPYNRHLGGNIGTLDPATGLPWADCPRDTVGSCAARLGTNRFWPGFNTVIETINNFQTKGPNLPAKARGNEGALSDPIRMVYGKRFVRGLRLLAYRPELNANHPEKGFVAALFEIGEGPVQAITDFRINNILVGFEHLNLRPGDLGQPPTAFSPNVNSYSGTAVGFGRVQGDYRNVSNSGLSGTATVCGYRDVRVYTDANTYVESYSQQPVWNVLDMLTRKRCAYGEDHSRYNIPSAIATAAWHAAQVSFRDANGNVFAGTRSTSNTELNARATQQQIYDACVAARMAVPFQWAGQKHFYPLKKETIDSKIPVFTTRGSGANICLGSNNRAAINWSYTSDDELVNQINISLDDDANAGENITIPFADQLQQLKAGKAWGDRTKRAIPKAYPAFGITNMPEAARLANLLLYLGPLDSGGIKNNLRVTFTTWLSQAFRIRPYQLVQLIVPELDIYGFDYFRVMKITRQPNLQVELEVQAYPVDFYEQMETEVAPIETGYVTENPGGRLGDRAFDLGFSSIDHTNDRVHFTLGT